MAKRGVNRMILMGTIGKDPEIRYFPDGGGVCNLSVATSESWKDKRTGEKQERTEWHSVTIQDRGAYKMAELAAQYLKKGSKVYIEGHLKTREYEKDGIKRKVTEIIADEMQFMGDAQQRTATQPAGQVTAPQQPAPRQPVAGQTEGQRRGPDPAQAPQGDFGHGYAPAPQGSFDDDDIPF